MNKRSLEQLYKIAEIRGVDNKSGVNARKKALDLWIEEWIHEVTFTQAVIKRNFTSEEHDFLAYHMSFKLAEQLMDEGFIELNLNKNEVSTGLLALKR